MNSRKHKGLTKYIALIINRTRKDNHKQGSSRKQVRMKQYILIIFILISESMQGQTISFTFIDGMANCYFISDTQIVYKPVTKQQSSSGEYDGGPAKTISINQKTFLKLSKLANKIIADKKLHEKYRNMGDGVIELDKVSVNFNGKSPLYKKIHDLLLKTLQ